MPITTFIQAIFDIPADGPFDYAVPPSVYKKIVPGMRVVAPFRNRPKVGIVVKTMAASEFENPKFLTNVPDDHPVYDTVSLELARKMADHYGCSWGEALAIGQPKCFGNKTALKFSLNPNPARRGIARPQTIVLHDPSGKNRLAVYRNLIKKMNAAGRSVLILLPDATAMTHMRDALKDLIPPGSILEAAGPSSVKDEFQRWTTAVKGEANVILGVRAALFYAIPNLGMIIVDNEDHTAYKEEQKPFYHVRDVALWKSRLAKCHLVLASAAPSVEAWALVEKGEAEWMDVPAKSLPAVQAIDMAIFKEGKVGLLSPPLRNHLEKSLAERKKVVVYFPLVSDTVGKVENIFRMFFPTVRVERYDRDDRSLPKNFDILLTTQAIFKWQARTEFDSVVILDIDMEINRMDFRSSHRSLAVMAHLRTMAKDKLVIQTHLWEHPSIRAMVTGDWKTFYAQESASRRDMGLPPYQHLVALVQRGPDEASVLQATDLLYNTFSSEKTEGFEILDPQQDARPVLRNQFRYTIMFMGPDVGAIQRFIKSMAKPIKKNKDIITTINVDP